jgi:gamma-glutamyltranspeptidase/glutathione hydrolase
MFRNPALGASLRLIAQHGRDGFYGGPTAEAIVATSRKLGGAMTLDDLAKFQPEWVKSISTTYRGWTVYETPPNTQGIAALMMLDLVEQFPLAEYGFHSPQALHVMIEAKKLAYADMLRYVADPRLASIPVPQMLDKGRAAERAKLIGERANCAVKVSEFKELTASNADDTIYMTAIDREGNIVSLIASNASGFGSGIVPSATGFMLHNRGQAFTLESGHPNTLAGRKRPLHTIIPALMQKGDVRIGFRIMGGWNQAQAHAQFVSNIADHGMNLQQALEAGRFSKKNWEGCDVPIEDLVPAPTRAQLSALGHELEVISERSFDFGMGQAVMSDGSGTHYGASDPRHDGAAIPEPAPVFEALSRPRQVPGPNR